jgi:hypothetical protein
MRVVDETRRGKESHGDASVMVYQARLKYRTVGVRKSLQV